MSQEQKSEGASPSTPREGSLQAHSCVLCKQRKVKCDKRYPCTQCARARVQCIFKAPAPPRRGKRKPTEINLLARLKRYEDMLQALGVTIETVKVEDESTAKDEGDNGQRTLPPFSKDVGGIDSSQTQRGKLLAGEEGKSIYFENVLWKSLSDEIQNHGELLEQASDDEDEEEDGPVSSLNEWYSADILFSPGKSSSIRVPHPPQEVVSRLWKAFTESVNPLCKVVHVPTTYATLADAMINPAHMPRNLEALLFCIYALSVSTLEPAECDRLFNGEKQNQIIERFILGSRLAFQRAGLLRSSDTMLVQAFVLHLFLIRTRVDSRILWIYTGICVRLAQRVGLHRDGSKLNLNPFETEMRRRIWWQVVVLDSHASMVSGSSAGLATDSWDTELPKNLNDDQLWPDMTETPVPQEGATEMIFCMVRYEFGRVFRTPSLAKLPDDKVNVQGLYNAMRMQIGPGNVDMMKLEIAEKDRRIDETEQRIGDKFFRYVDAFNDLHVLSLGIARTAIASMRLMAHHPRQYADGGASLPQKEKDTLFASAARILEYDCNAHSSPNLRRFRWHFAAFFQANAFVVVLSELCVRTQGTEVESTWHLVEECYRNHPEIFDDQRRLINAALANLALRAWRAREAAHPAGCAPLVRPECIEKILKRRATANAKSKSQDASPASSNPTHTRGHTPRSYTSASASSSSTLQRQEEQLREQVRQQILSQQKVQQGIQTLNLRQANPQASETYSGDNTSTNTYPFNPLFASTTDTTPSSLSNPSSYLADLTPSPSAASPVAPSTVSPSELGRGSGAVPAATSDPWMLLGSAAEPMDWAAWDDLLGDAQLDAYGLDGSMAPLGLGFGDVGFGGAGAQLPR